MAMVVTVQDTDDPYGRTGRAVQDDNGSWAIEYHQHGELLAVHSIYGPGGSEDEEPPKLLDQDEADVALFMCEVLADSEQFAGTFPAPGYQRNRHVWPADRCTLCFETVEFHEGGRADHPFTGSSPGMAGGVMVAHKA